MVVSPLAKGEVIEARPRSKRFGPYFRVVCLEMWTKGTAKALKLLRVVHLSQLSEIFTTLA